jgi:hypothetical protein
MWAKYELKRLVTPRVVPSLVKQEHLSEIRLYISKSTMGYVSKKLEKQPQSALLNSGNSKFYPPCHVLTHTAFSS